MTSKKKPILDRVRHLEDAIVKGQEYLKNGRHADWLGFRPLFKNKVKKGKVLPPHKDWIKNVFLPNHEKALTKAHALLDRPGRR